MTLETTQAFVKDVKGQEIDKPSIWIACLSAYNSGYLHGAWIVPKTTVEELQEQIKEVLKTSPVGDPEEWAIHDYNNFVNLGENPSLAQIVEVAKTYEDFEPSIVNGFIENFGSFSPDQLKENLEDAYVGTYDNFKEYAYQHADDTIEGLDSGSPLAMYFDYDSYARDLKFDHWEADAPGYKVHIYRSY